MTDIRNWTALKSHSVLARRLIPLAAVALSAFLATRIEALTPVLPFVLAGLIALAGAALAVRFGTFQRGILLIVLTAGLLGFFTLPTGRDSRVVISLALSLVILGIWLVRLIFHSVSGDTILPSPINKPLLLFVGVNIVSYVWSLFMRDPLLVIWPSFPSVQIAALLVNVSLPLLLLLTANKAHSSQWFKILMWMVICIGAVNILSRLLNLPTIALVNNSSRGLFVTWVGAFAWALLLFDRQLRRYQQAFLIAIILGQIYYYFFLNRLWLSGWLPMLVAMAVVTFCRSRKLFVVLSIVGLIVAALNFDNLYNTIFVANENEGGLQRLDLWQMNLQHVANHPLLGMGPAGYAPYNMTYHPNDARSTHNNYFDVLAQTGIIGLALYIAMFAVLVRMAAKTVRAFGIGNGALSAFAAAVAGGLAASIVAMALGDWILPFAYNQSITGFDNASISWISFGALAAMYQWRATFLGAQGGVAT